MSSKTIYQSSNRIPFTYYIKWTKLGISYYGCRYSNGCVPSDLWTKYFTSSKHVKEFRKLHGEPDIIKVTKTFNTIESCRNWENRFLKRITAHRNPKLLNRSNPGSYGISLFKPKTMPGNTGPVGITEKLMKDTCALLGLEYSDKPKSLANRYWVNYKEIIVLYFDTETDRTEFLLNNNTWSSGRNTTKTKQLISSKLKGVSKPTRTSEHLRKIGVANLGKKKPNSGPKGMKVYHNYTSEIRLPQSAIPPEGYLPGRIPGKYGNKNFGSDMMKIK